MDLGLKNKVALVAAASQGLGAAVAQHLAVEGAQVAICSRNKDRIEDRATLIRAAAGADVLPVVADVTVGEDVERLISTVIERFGRLDILVANAGGPPSAPFMDLSPADFQAAFDLNMMSTVRLCYAAVPHMLAQGGGTILTITSVAVKQPIENLVLSNSVRLAVIGLTKTLANELGPRGIRVNSILPGWTRTSRVKELLETRARLNQSTEAEEAKRIAGSFPLGRMAEPDEFARVATFLASPAACYVHGVALQVDGGATKGVF